MFSKACQYAIRAVIYLAAETTSEQRKGVKDIAEALDVPGPFLAKLLQQLTRNHLVSSTKGPHGGFYLSEKDRSSTLRAVVDCIDGPQVLSSCILGLPVCSSTNPCPLHDQALLYRQGLLQVLDHKTIGDLAGEIHHKDDLLISKP